MKVWRQLHDRLLGPDSQAVLITVLEADGSCPCAPGARMIVTPGDRAVGTIGGGMLEWEAVREAGESLDGNSGKHCWKVSKLLGPDLAQCCGGAVTLLFERFSHADLAALAPLALAEDAGAFTTKCTIESEGPVWRRISDQPAAAGPGSQALELSGPDAFSESFGVAGTPLMVFGAGHVGKALIYALAPLPFEVTWVDSREGIFPEDLPSNTRALNPAAPPQVLAQAAPGSMIVIMTHSHALDLELVAAALGTPFCTFVGLIGSQSKCARFRKRLRDRGIPGDAVERLVCPIGIPGITGKQPAVIAASVAAQLLGFTTSA